MGGEMGRVGWRLQAHWIRVKAGGQRGQSSAVLTSPLVVSERRLCSITRLITSIMVVVTVMPATG